MDAPGGGGGASGSAAGCARTRAGAAVSRSASTVKQRMTPPGRSDGEASSPQMVAPTRPAVRSDAELRDHPRGAFDAHPEGRVTPGRRCQLPKLNEAEEAW